jgi:hypothetical protein
MQRFICLLLLLLSMSASAQSDIKIKSKTKAKNHIPFQGTKWYCGFYNKTKYRVTIKGDKVTIAGSYEEHEEITEGKIKNGKIYSDDPSEKNIKKFAGRLYVLDGNIFRVLNGDNGDYEDFTQCKN